MAPPLLSLLLLFLLLTSTLSSPTPQLLLPLTHALSKTNHIKAAAAAADTFAAASTLLKSASHRSAARFRHRRHSRQLSLPLSSGSDYTLSVSVGSAPSQTVDLYMDTGSDLVWLPCSPFECILCEGKPKSTPPLSSSLSSPVSCSSPACSAAHSSLPSSDLCAIAGCPIDDIEMSSCSSSSHPCPTFYYAYGDGSLVANLRTDHVAIPAESPGTQLLRVRNFTFGCAHSTLAEPVGVAGFGRGILSLPGQLSELSPHLGKRFSYCLVSHSFDSGRLRHPSPLILGRSTTTDDESDSSSSFIYTPMLDNPKHPYFYSVGLEAISVGRHRIPSDPSLTRVDRDGNGAFVVDSGTTFTMLPTGLHARVREAFDRLMRNRGYDRAPAAEAETGLAPCYDGGNSSEPAAVPSLVLHFSGNASVALPARNYYYATKGGGGAGCLMLMNGGDESDGGPAGTLGNIQQQGFEVVYDLEGRRVGFARKRCALLWESLSRGRGT